MAMSAAGQDLAQSNADKPCASVVVVRCDREAEAAGPTQDRAKRDVRRRAASDPFELDRIIIEADPVRRSLEESMTRALGPRPTWGTRTFSTAEGSQCTCMTVCPPLPFPCCQCSAHMRGYSSSPGSSPFN